MKKLTVLAALLLAVSAGGTAFAKTEYDPANGSVKTDNQDKYKTVLITEGSKSDPVTDGNIVYADQAANNFQAATKFLLQYNSDDGKSVKDGLYTIRLGGSDGQINTAEFVVGVGIEGYDTELTNLDNEQDSNGKYSWGFVTPEDGVSFSNGGIILVKLGDDVMAYPTDNGLEFSGNIKAVFGVQIDEVPENQSVAVYFRPGASIRK